MGLHRCTILDTRRVSPPLNGLADCVVRGHARDRQSDGATSSGVSFRRVLRVVVRACSSPLTPVLRQPRRSEVRVFDINAPKLVIFGGSIPSATHPLTAARYCAELLSFSNGCVRQATPS